MGLPSVPHSYLYYLEAGSLFLGKIDNMLAADVGHRCRALTQVTHEGTVMTRSKDALQR